MIFLGHINNPRACKAFSDYLKTQGIEHQIKLDEEDKQISLFVLAEQFESAQVLFSDFVANPEQEKYLQASWQVNETISGTGQSLGLKAIWQANGAVTKAITLICIGIYVLSTFGYFVSIFNQLSFSWQVEQIYRLFTPAIMHLSALHLAFNMSWWWYLGGKVENHLGAQPLIVIMILTAISSNISQALLVDTNFAGLSGVNYGLAGFVWLYGRLTQHPQINLANNIFGFLIVWMLLGFVDLLPINMANWAHLFGLLSGLALAKWLHHKKGSVS